MTPLFTLHDDQNNMTVNVFPYEGGRFSVVLRDDDAGETATVNIFPTLERAVEYAKTLIL